VLNEEPKPLRAFVKDVPPDLERIILSCLRKAREERFASASEIKQQLEDCRALVSADGINLGTIFRHWKRPVFAIPALIILLLLGGLTSWWVQRSFKPGGPEAKPCLRSHNS
jgi:hypothetical protein